MTTKISETSGSSLSDATTTNYLSTENTLNYDDWYGREVLPISPHPFPTSSSLTSPFSSCCSRVKSKVPIIFSNNDDINNVKMLPSTIQEIIKTYIDPVDYLLDKIQREESIPEVLEENAKRAVCIDLQTKKLSESQLLKLLRYCRNIKVLNLPLPLYYDEMTSMVAPRLGGMMRVDFSPAVQQIIESIANLKNLKHLDMSQWNVQQTTNFSTDHMVSQLVSNGKLRYLNLAGYSFLSDIGVYIIVNNCKKLQHLNLNSCTSITHLSLTSIQQLTNLKSVTLHRCSRIPLAYISMLRIHNSSLTVMM